MSFLKITTPCQIGIEPKSPYDMDGQKQRQVPTQKKGSQNEVHQAADRDKLYMLASTIEQTGTFVNTIPGTSTGLSDVEVCVMAFDSSDAGEKSSQYEN